jgi:RecJ-like exonuclease
MEHSITKAADQWQKCPECKGTGWITLLTSRKPCPLCSISKGASLQQYVLHRNASDKWTYSSANQDATQDAAKVPVMVISKVEYL